MLKLIQLSNYVSLKIRLFTCITTYAEIFLELLLSCLFFLCSTFCVAEIINSVNTIGNGNKRISKESIIVFGKIDLNKDYNQVDLNLILKNLYETQFF